ncbi:ERI1 exoribonuclease 2 [Megalobrama amblycephala]|uniref:ERI1 exoribonuclease 2 n=1 Tax=Megalobrama amblycephala TaxID=75352 RepID=UPI002013CF78|nr:ERI1 exoribonuclease 2 [Megalobrama amblycephala]
MTTKSLAKELGLIRRRSRSSGAHRRASVRKQRFSFLIVIDFESTCWREKNGSGQEIIEFPAVLLNVSNGAVESEFHTFVQPQEHPVLSDFCTELTGITQDQVDSAPPLHICLSRFVRWLLRLQQERGVVFETDSAGPAPSGHPCAFVTWSDWDLGVCLLYECKRKQLTVPEALKSWIDLRATYRLFYNRKPKGLRGALLDLGIQFTGREHSGLVDARNTALLAWRMVSDGCLLTVTKSLRPVPVKSRPPLRNTSGSLSAERRARDEPQASVCRALVTPRTVLSSTITSLPDLQETSNAALAGLSDTTYDPETPDACWRDGVLLTEEEEPGSYDDVPLGAEPDENQPNKTTSNQHKPSVSTGVFKTPKPLPRTDPYGPLSRFLGRSTAPFSVYKDPPISVPRPHLSKDTPISVPRPHLSKDPPISLPRLHLAKDMPVSVPRLHLSKDTPISVPRLHLTKDTPISVPRLHLTKDTPISVPRPHLSKDTPISVPHPHLSKDTPISKSRPPLACAVGHSSKRTAPLCGCGRRARRLTVGNGGPNHGRVFFCCPVRRQSCGGPQKGCDFFQWESGLMRSRAPHQLRTPQTFSSRALR